MAKTSRTQNAPADAMASLSQAFETAQSRMDVPAAARDFLKRGATAAQERIEDLHEGMTGATARAENLATAAVSNYADFTRGLFDTTLANIRHALVTVEKVAGAASINEVVQIQSDFIRESAAANFERAREAGEVARVKLADGAKAWQDEVQALVTSKAA